MKQKIDRNWEFRLTGSHHTPWRHLDIPHDWAIEGDFAESNYMHWINSERHLEFRHNSYLPHGTGEYRKMLDIPVHWPDQKIYLEFDGVFGESILYIDGKKAGENHSGYTGKVYDITPFAAGKNQVEIRLEVSAEKMQGWWYEGAGIYRHVHLILKPACHIIPWGIAVTTPEISGDQAKVVCSVETAGAGNLQITLSAPDGKIAAEKNIPVQNGLNTVEFQLDNIIRWDVDSPMLYSARFTLTRRPRSSASRSRPRSTSPRAASSATAPATRGAWRSMR